MYRKEHTWEGLESGRTSVARLVYKGGLTKDEQELHTHHGPYKGTRMILNVTFLERARYACMAFVQLR